jgi:uncharacterized protein YjiS (DUF1127 family)
MASRLRPKKLHKSDLPYVKCLFLMRFRHDFAAWQHCIHPLLCKRSNGLIFIPTRRHRHKRRPPPERKTKMMMSDVSQAHAGRAGWTAPFAALRDVWSRYRVYKRTYAELNALTTRELDDLGIARSMITRLAYEAAYGRNA